MGYRFCFILLIAVTGVLFAFRQYGPRPYPFPELTNFPPMPVNGDNPVSVEGAELGRNLFYDSILSLDYSMSCASCHRMENAFADAGKRFSKGISGTEMKRNTPPLFNLAWYEAFFWDGRAGSLEEQVFEPVRAHDEMNLNWKEAVKRIRAEKRYRGMFHEAFGDTEIDSILIAKAIAQFERTLLSHNSKYDRVLRGEAYFTHKEYRGFVLVNDQTKGDCLHCHTTDGDVLGTTGRFSNNGLDAIDDPLLYRDPGRGGFTGKKEDMGRFRIPGFRNLSFTAPYMHDGRFETLEEVLQFYNSGVYQSANIDPKMTHVRKGGVRLSPEEMDTIITFLRTLSDSVFVSKEAYANPFLKRGSAK